MTVNANVRCVEWHDAMIVKPIGQRFVIGWFPRHFGGTCLTVRLLNDDWWFEGDAIGLPQDPTPSHWCEFPAGPG